MKIKLSAAGKRFNREWIFRNANLEFNSQTSYAITGPNGSGKSTLLQCLGGMFQLSEGQIQYAIGNGQLVNGSELAVGSLQLANEEVYKQISFCAPYMDVIEEMTLIEFLKFHQQFKPFITDFTIEKIIAAIGLEVAANKQIRFYSSGMKQRVKLAQAIFSDVEIILLDEPCSNLDANGIELYHSLIKNYCLQRLVIVCSNDEVEYNFCKEIIAIQNFRNF